MTKEYWVEAALTNDCLVAEFLLRLKRFSSSDSLKHAPPPPTPATPTPTPTPTKITSLPLPSGWGNRKNRSKSTPSTFTTVVTKGLSKEQRGSPTTHLSWSGGGGSTSDGCEESSRKSDLSSGSRSAKTNEGASTSGYNTSHKRKSFTELKDVEGSLLKERVHINTELASMRSNLNQQMATSVNLKRIKIDFDENSRKEISCRVEAEREKGFVLPDLNMIPSEEDVAMMN